MNSQGIRADCFTPFLEALIKILFINNVTFLFFFFPREDDGYRLISEQVSHHPPVSAFHAQSLKQEFEFHGSIYPKLKFWGKSVEADPKGIMTLELLKWVFVSFICDLLS